MKSVRTQIYLPEWLKSEAKKAADDMRVNLSEFIRDSLKETLRKSKNKWVENEK